jgi:hypothetical protein
MYVQDSNCIKLNKAGIVNLRSLTGWYWHEARIFSASSLNLCWYSVDYDSCQMKQQCWVGTWFCGLEMWVFISMRKQSKLEWGLILGTGPKIRIRFYFILFYVMLKNWTWNQILNVKNESLIMILPSTNKDFRINV